jgi:fucose permease
VTPAQVRSWRRAVFAVFALNGIGMASWTSRLPVIREDLGLGIAQMGLLVIALPIGGLVGVMLSSHLLHALGGRRTVQTSIVFSSAGLALVGIGSSAMASPTATFVGFVVFGLANGLCNVAINVEGTAVERAGGTTVMPMFHASWSIGTFVGAGVGAFMSLLGVPVAVHVGTVAVIVAVVIVLAAARFPEIEVAVVDTTKRAAFAQRMAVWAEPRTLLLGLLIVSTAFTEGAANNWLAIAMVDSRGVDAATGAAYVAVFTGSMTAGRLLGSRAIDALGRVTALRGSFALALAGLLLVILVDHPIATVTGVVLWGLGASLAYPLGMSAAADDPVGAAARVGAVAAMASISAFIGPIVIGFIGEHLGLLAAFFVPVGLISVAMLFAGVARPAREQISLDSESISIKD